MCVRESIIHRWPVHMNELNHVTCVPATRRRHHERYRASLKSSLRETFSASPILSTRVYCIVYEPFVFRLGGEKQWTNSEYNIEPSFEQWSLHNQTMKMLAYTHFVLMNYGQKL